MARAFCPACGMDVEVVVMTVGTGVSAEESTRCELCGFVLEARDDDARPACLFEHIAIAEDQENVRRAVRDDLIGNQLAKSVDEFPDGGAIVAALRSGLAQGRGYQLVILDLNMPIMDGLKVGAFLRALERQLQLLPTPILFFSAAVCDDRLKNQLGALRPAFYVNKGTIKGRADLAGRLEAVLGQIKARVEAA